MLQVTSSGRSLIYSRNKVGPKMDSWGTPASTGCSCEDSHFEPLEVAYYWKKKKKPNNWPEIPSNLSLWRRAACQTFSKAVDKSIASVWVAQDLLSAQAILSDGTVRRSIDYEDLKPYWKLDKRPHFSRWSTSLLFTSFSKTLVTTERSLTVW